ncbi:hypothetical protein, partial [Streptococcus pneumoniae]|uniref:hypothetical protein n=1 Tax=Streptococcus pneumoniae TaxID=1313 RepID=UPI001C5DA6EC
YQKRKDKICPFSSLADFNPLQLTKSRFSLSIISHSVLSQHQATITLHIKMEKMAILFSKY